ncbi:MAG: aminotransferase class V-fold PLP-dependent enzyme, partial [Pyrinomonadaceae bacterium]
YGIRDEPVIAESIAAGVDLVSFSGDKLLGGVQSGIIAGRHELIEKIRKHPLYRALRVDKIVYAALEVTLESFRHERAVDEIPVLRMLSMTKSEISRRATSLAETLKDRSDLIIEIIDGKSAVGGGASPDFQPETTLIALTHTTKPAQRLEYTLRLSDPPVIARIVDGKVLLDMRTVNESEEEELAKILSQI